MSRHECRDGGHECPRHLVTPCLSCRFKIIDIRDWDAETLLQGKHPADAVLAILGRHSDRPETIRRILQRIGKMKAEDRNAVVDVAGAPKRNQGS